MSQPTIMNTNDPVLLMCPPEYYAIPQPNTDAGHANDFAYKGYKEQEKDPKKFRNIAFKQYNNLKSAFNALGILTPELPPKKDMPDLCFTADPTLSLITVAKEDALKSNPSAITILSRFSNEEREMEVLVNATFLEEMFPKRGFMRSHFRTEGTGDNVYDPYRDVIWSGFVPNAGRMNAASGRSDARAHKALELATGAPVISMAVKKPFFHIDTSMAPLTNGHILCFKEGMQPEAYETLLREGLDRYGLPHEEYLIEVDEKDAYRYACNLRCIGDTIVMPECSDSLKDHLHEKGYDVVTIDMTQFIHSGGAVHCLTNNLNERRVIGGTCEQFGFGRRELSID